jgi:hypothetical protein
LNHPIGKAVPSDPIPLMKSTPPTTSSWVFLVGFLVIAGPFGVGVYTTVEAIRDGADTEETQGTVIAREWRKPVVEYHVAGQTYRCTGKVSGGGHAVGDQVSVRYKIDDPSIGFIDSVFDRWLCPLLFLGGGSFFLGGLLFGLIRQIKYQRTAARIAARRNLARQAS